MIECLVEITFTHTFLQNYLDIGFISCYYVFRNQKTYLISLKGRDFIEEDRAHEQNQRNGERTICTDTV